VPEAPSINQIVGRYLDKRRARGGGNLESSGKGKSPDKSAEMMSLGMDI